MDSRPPLKKSRSNGKVCVTIAVSAGANGHPSCSRTGSGDSEMSAFRVAEEKVIRSFDFKSVQPGATINVVARVGECKSGKVGEGTDLTPQLAISAAWRSLFQSG